MATTNLGRVRFNMRGDYNPAADPLYSLLDLVSDGGGSFVYINDTPSTEPTSSASHWQQIASMGGQELVDAAVAARDAAQGYKDDAANSAAQLAAGLLRPKGTYVDLDALNAGTPTAADTDEIYITLDDGKWCYHDGTTWVAGGVYQAASVVGDIASINSQLEDVVKDVDDKISASSNYKRASLAGSVINVTQKNVGKYTGTAFGTSAQGATPTMIAPVTIVDSDADIIATKRNLFNIASATINSPTGYASQSLVTKTATGFYIDMVQNSASALYKTIEYTAPESGVYVVTCFASGPEEACMLGGKLGGTVLEIVRGTGKIGYSVALAQGDVWTINFYCKVNGAPLTGVFTYSDIQIERDVATEFVTYSDGESYNLPVLSAVGNTADEFALETGIITRKVLKITLNGTESWSWLSSTTAGPGKYWKCTEFADEIVCPADNNTNANIMCNFPIKTYNQTYNNSEGVGVSSTGTISVYAESANDLVGNSEFKSWLASNPIVINAVRQTHIQESSDAIIIDPKYARFVLSGSQLPTLDLDVYEDIKSSIADARTSKIEGKVGVIFGDSINGKYTHPTDISSYISDRTGATIYNAGFTGCQMSTHASAAYAPFSFNKLVDAIVDESWIAQEAQEATQVGWAEKVDMLQAMDWSGVDFICVMYGTNDFGANKYVKESDIPEGTSATVDNCFETAMRYSLDKFLTRFPHIQILCLGCIWRAISTGKDSDIDTNINGDFLREFNDEVIKIANDFHLPSLDMYHSSGINKYTNAKYLSDGTHPNVAGRKKIGNKIGENILIEFY